VDDIVDTAGTLCKAADVLMENGAKEVHSYITHGVLSGPAVDRITKSVMKNLVITGYDRGHRCGRECAQYPDCSNCPYVCAGLF
jgi:phosphoribosylpyrophosphate synthetase